VKYIEVALDLPLQRSFQYGVPAELAPRVKIGSRVLVPFRNRNLTGFVTRENKEGGEKQVRDVIKLIDDFPAVSPPLLKLGQWISDYYHCSLGQSLHSMLPIQYSLKNKEERGEVKKAPCPSPLPPELSCFGDHAARKKGNVFLLKAQRTKEKTSIFLSLIREVLARGRQVVLVVPEISYISSWHRLIQSEYRNSVAIFHSRLTKRQRYIHWMRMRKGEAHLAIGTRCLVFAPFPNLGLIVLDEEENLAYKQRETPRYHAREVAAKRGEIEGFPVVLMSQAPSLESWDRLKKGEYLSIPSSTTPRVFPRMEIVDLCRQEDRIFSTPLKRAVKEALERHELAILFLDKRGFSRYLFCEECGEVLRCPNCNIGLTFHLRGTISCHYCSYQEQSPVICPYCKGDKLRGMGIGTEQVEGEAKMRFPKALVRRADLDIGSSSLYGSVRDDVIKGKIDILVGTKLIIKEEILREAQMVGIILADSLLNLPDFRASERLFQLLVKIKRSIKREGKILIQTYNPTHYSLRCVRDREEDFYAEEMRVREELHYPPWVHWTRILLEGKTKAKVAEAGQRIANELDEKRVKFLGPSPCPFTKIKSRYRYQLILRNDDLGRISNFLKGELTFSSRSFNRVKVSVDVDPQELM
jgi:primosomal protein N' (replication factor Y)